MADTSGTDVQIAHTKNPSTIMSSDRKADAWVAIGVDPDRYNQFVENLSQDTKISILKNKKLQDNYLKIHKAISGISNYIIDLGLEYEKLSEETFTSCKALLGLRELLKDALSEEASSPFFSIFSLKMEKAKKLAIKINIDDRKVSISLTDRLNSKNFLLGEVEDYGNECGENPIETALLSDLLKKAAMLKALNVNDPQNISYENFQDIFSDDVVVNLESHIEKIKKDLKNGILKIDELVLKYTESRQKYFLKEIKSLVYDLYEKQLMACEESGSPEKNYELRMEGKTDSAGFPAWEIYKATPGTFYGEHKKFVYGFQISIAKNHFPFLTPIPNKIAGIKEEI